MWWMENFEVALRAQEFHSYCLICQSIKPATAARIFWKPTHVHVQKSLSLLKKIISLLVKFLRVVIS